MLKYFTYFCVGDGGSSRVLPMATAFLCLRKLMTFLKVVYIFIELTRFSNSNELRSRVYHLIYAVQLI